MTPRVRERAVVFGRERNLTGILTSPSSEKGAPSGTAFVILNSGVIHRIGSNRVSVRMARAVADLGIPVFRFDQSGLGDSEARGDVDDLEESVERDIDEAMEHIALYGSGHTDSIITEDFSRARRFLREVDASSVMVNASTRFADGFEYGLGAEIGISTDKFHARGPVGLEGLTSVKFVVLGDGTIRT